MTLLRSMLYFPANSVRMIVKSTTLPADAVILDLEDAVSLDDKETARMIARDFIRLIKQRGIHVFVRVNSIATDLTIEDLRSTVVEGLDGVMLAKTETESDIARVCEMLKEAEKCSGVTPQSTQLIPLVESAKGVVNSLQIASASDRVVAVAFGAGDYYRDLGRDVSSISKEQIELLYARSQIVNVSRATGVQAIDSPFLGSLTDKESYLREVAMSAQLGFNGKQCIHPSQIEPINNAFSPSRGEIERAGRIEEAFEQAQARGLGVISFEGRMVDRMTYRQAKEVLATARTIDEKKRSMMQKTPFVTVSEVFSRQ